MNLLVEAIDIAFKRYLHREEKLRDPWDEESTKRLSFEGSLFRREGMIYIRIRIGIRYKDFWIHNGRDLDMKQVISLKEAQGIIEDLVDRLIDELLEDTYELPEYGS